MVEDIWKQPFFLPPLSLSAQSIMCYFEFASFWLSAALPHPRCSPLCTLPFTSLRDAIPSGLHYCHILPSPVLLFASLTVPSANRTIFLLRIPNFFLLHLGKKIQTPSCDVYRVSAQRSLLLLISPTPLPPTNLSRCSPSPKHVFPAKGQWLLRSSFLA